jgi:hypothetical protein
MSEKRGRQPSGTMIVSMLALVVALAGQNFRVGAAMTAMQVLSATVSP